MSEIGASTPGGINFPTKGNRATFERLKITARCNFNAIIELRDSGMLHCSWKHKLVVVVHKLYGASNIERVTGNVTEIFNTQVHGRGYQ